MVGGSQEQFLTLIQFERGSSGLPPGDRQLLAEGWRTPALVQVGDRTIKPDAAAHPLLQEFELSADQVLQLISEARRLKMAVRGWVAEEKLREVLSLVSGVTDCERLDAEGGPDLRLRWRGGPLLTIECKNVGRTPSRDGFAKIDFQRTRASKSDPCSRYYAPSDFDIVAGCLHAVTERWEFQYVVPTALGSHKSCAGKLASNVVVDQRWTPDAGTAFEHAYAQQ